MRTADARQRQQDARRRLVMHIRSQASDPDDGSDWTGLGESVGVTRGALLALFRDEHDLLDAVNDALVAETKDRLRSATDAVRSTPKTGDEADVRALVCAVVRSCPLDRSSLLVRAERRRRALRRVDLTHAATRAERRFLDAVQSDIAALLAAIGREARPTLSVAARAFLNGYERAFEAWLLNGGSERNFEQSGFAQHELPALALALSRPMSPDHLHEPHPLNHE